MTSFDEILQWQEDNYLCQILKRPRKPFNPLRILRHSAFAALIYAPLAYLWYPNLEKTLPGTDVWYVIAKVAADQLIWTPPILCILFIWTSLWQTKSLKDGFRQIQCELWKTLRVNWIVWPCVQAFNLSIIPGSYRIIVVNLVNIPWTAFLSLASNRKNKIENQKKVPAHVNLPATA